MLRETDRERGERARLNERERARLNERERPRARVERASERECDERGRLGKTIFRKRSGMTEEESVNDRGRVGMTEGESRNDRGRE